MTPQELLALNDEVVGLLRSGSTVRLGLPRHPRLMESTLDRISTEVVRKCRLEGPCDEELLCFPGIPPAYRHVLEVGIRHGRLPVAFESLTDSARRVGLLRRELRLSLVYPLVVAVLAVFLMAYLATIYLPQLVKTYDVMRLPKTAWTDWAFIVQEYRWAWELLPVFLVTSYILYRFISQRLSLRTTDHYLLARLPGLNAYFRDVRLADFAELLFQLRQKDVPHSLALPLAAATSGEPRLASAQFVAFNKARSKASGVPPLLGWALSATDELEGPALRTASQFYRERAGDRARWLKKVVPMGLCLVVAGTAVSCYVMTFWAPLCDLILQLSAPSTVPGRF